MLDKLIQYLNYFKVATKSIINVGFIATYKKIKNHFKVRRNNRVFDLIALKPVMDKWYPENKLEHKYDISVIIPTYNRAKMLEDVLDCWREVAEATRYSFEIIFSDDGSVDESIQILKKVTDLPLKILANDHGGVAKARNSAILAAEGRKLLIIGDDIFPNKEILNQHYEKLQELDITDAVLGECVWHKDLNVNHLMVHITEIGHEQFSFNVFEKHMFTDFRHFYTCNISIDREFLLSEKLIFDERFYKINFEDIELGYRLAKKGMKIYYYPEASGQHFHSYNDIKKFCLRQEVAGEMGLVFIRLHEEIDAILLAGTVESRWLTYAHHTDRLDLVVNVYNELIDFCQYVEDHNDTKNSNLSKSLSDIYTSLFRFSYEKGIFQTRHEVYSELINEIFKNEFYEDKIKKALVDLNDKCAVPNFETIYKILTNDIVKKKSLTILCDSAEDVLNYSKFYSELGGYVICKTALDPTDADELYYKPEKKFYLSVNAIKQIILFYQKYTNIDMILLSFGLHDLPFVGLSHNPGNNIIGKKAFVESPVIKIPPGVNAKVIRLFDMSNERLVPVAELFEKKNIDIDDYGFIGSNNSNILPATNSNISFEINENINKPVVFVFPIFLAVGGVEKNTIEIIKELNSTYDFVVINFERLNMAQGSLHQSFSSFTKAIYDLTEMSSHNDILSYLRVLQALYQPTLIWICNGSPWLEENILSLRELFSNNVIVDQQVYDEKEGWIKVYDKPGIHRFDRFIAVNSKIKNIFIEEKGVPRSKVNLIYSAVKNIDAINVLKNEQEAFRLKYDIASETKTFIFVGRMTEQKRPLMFLEFIKNLPDEIKYNFILVGDGELSDDVDAFIKRNKMDNVRQIKYIEKLEEIYSVIDGLLIFSKFEGLPIAMLEALCVGVPVFSSDVGDISPVLEKYKAGETFSRDLDIETISNLFHVWNEHLSVYKKNLLQSNADVRHDFSVSNIAKEYRIMWDSAIKEKNNYVS